MASGSDKQPIDVSNKITLLDGDLSRQIMRYTGTYPECIELYGNDKIRVGPVYNSHWNFLNSGSKLIRTNTYHALYPYLQKSLRLDENGYIEVLENAAHLARQSVVNYSNMNNIINPYSPRVVGTCGCFDNDIIDSLPPDKFKDAHRERIRVLQKNGVDTISLEGIRSTEEANMLFDLIREFPLIKFLAMFDADKVIDSSYNIVNSIQDSYNSYSSQITAIGLNNVNSQTAKIFCDKINDGRQTDNLISLVMCTNKCNQDIWNPIDAINDNPVVEWQRIGVRYVGGSDKVLSEDINAVREKLNPL